VQRDADSARWFAALGCRGFSYELTAAPRFRLSFPRRIDLRFALHLPRTLAHPSGVASALRRVRCQHVVSGGGRAAAFALGTARRETHGLVWYVFVLQSDLALLGPAALRDYLRGWRKVLFAGVLNAARSAGAGAVCLAPAEAVFHAAALFRGYDLRRLPPLWESIYDRTAADFGMTPGCATAPLNIQSVPRRRPYLCDVFHRLSLRESTEGWGTGTG
jgi:hypothetical protein